MSLRRSSLLVSRAAASPEYSDEAYGIPLSATEVVELRRRAKVQLALRPAIDYAMAVPSYAGRYTDQQSGGVPVFRFTDADEGRLVKLESLLPSDSGVRVESAKWTLEALDATREKLRGDWDGLEREFGLVSISINTRENQVRVGLLNPTEQVETMLRERFGASIATFAANHAVIDACNSEHDCFPIKGGLHIESSVNTGVDCTAGFVVRRELNGGQLALVTAGHCVELARENSSYTVNDPWNHGPNNSVFGSGKYETWHTGSDADVGLVGLSSSTVSDMTSASYNRLFTRAGTLNTSPIVNTYVVGSLASVYQDVGDQVCRYGIASDRDCGVIVDDDATMNSCRYGTTGCRPIDHTIIWSLDSIGGDSGGPMFVYESSNEVVVLGSHVHSSDETNPNTPTPYRSWYSPVDRGDKHVRQHVW